MTLLELLEKTTFFTWRWRDRHHIPLDYNSNSNSSFGCRTIYKDQCAHISCKNWMIYYTTVCMYRKTFIYKLKMMNTSPMMSLHYKKLELNHVYFISINMHIMAYEKCNVITKWNTLYKIFFHFKIPAFYWKLQPSWGTHQLLQNSTKSVKKF